MRKALIFFLILILTSIGVSAQVNSNHVKVSGYYRSDGTYVNSYYRTAPNSTNHDNFSTKGNVNPYTGKYGTISRDGVNYYSLRTINVSYQSNYNSTKSSGICKHGTCISSSTLVELNNQKKYSNFCKVHIPRCQNPSCLEFGYFNYFEGFYKKYCSTHTQSFR